MFILKQYNSKSGQLVKFADIVQAFNAAIALHCHWELFFKAGNQPAKLLAYKEN
jgi:hypothetical protein